MTLVRRAWSSAGLASYGLLGSDLPLAPAPPSWPLGMLVLLPIIAVLVPPGVMTALHGAFLVLAGIVWATSGAGPARPLTALMLPFLGICVEGLISGVGADLYLYLKDAWYVTNPVLTLAVGYVIYRCRPDVTRGLRAFVLAGTVVGVLYLVPFIEHPALLRAQATLTREMVGTGYFAPALALVILAACGRRARQRLALPPWMAALCTLLCVAATTVTFSRTIVLTTLAGLLANAGLFARRALLKFAVVLAVFLLAVSALRLTVDVDSADAKNSFVGKLARSFDEMAIHDYADRRHINENYRGYESARVLETYRAGEPLRWVFGQGFGAVVDLRLWITPNVGQFIPTMHNGYLYLLLKGGLVAVGLFALFLWRAFAFGKHSASSVDAAVRRAGRLVQGITVGLALSTWVISGVFNKEDLYPFMLCLGWLCGYLSSLPPAPAAAASAS
jgi:hypothetical protein